jgi:hypothetical protein
MAPNSMQTPQSKHELFDNVRAYWPETFRISSEQPALPAVVTIPSELKVYDSIEYLLGPKNEWLQLGAWAFHQALYQLFQRSYRASQYEVRTGDVSFKSFDTCMIRNLLDDSWAAERPIYAAMPLR